MSSEMVSTGYGIPEAPSLRVRVLGAPLDILSMESLLKTMGNWISRHERTYWIAVTGSHGIMEAYRDPSFRQVLDTADLSIPDGNWAARAAAAHAHCPLQQIRGADLLQAFCAASHDHGYSNYFFGDSAQVLGALERTLRVRYPRLGIAGTYSPPFRPLEEQENEEIVGNINRSRPDVLWVALGLPKQERWIAANLAKLDVPIVVAIGAAFKFVSGCVNDAPGWISHYGFEWLWRFFHEPRRTWHRAFVLGPQFAFYTLRELYGPRSSK
jgi:N-acetylglucosaminyldiphosphoundecaprenol N-acetyl-beta-D-mannosaminyltransferase